MADRSEQWSSRAAFVFATVGSAVGIGSIWKFPYEVGSNGGGIFVLLYLLGLVLIVLPLLLVEMALGRRGGSDATESLRRAAAEARVSTRWSLVGVLGVLTAFLILSFYSVIGGWILAYLAETATAGLPGADAAGVHVRFEALLGSAPRMALFHFLFMAIAAAIVALGVIGGIETACRVLMPVLIALLLALAIYSAVVGDLGAAARFLFQPDWSKATAKAALEALGLGFFSIGVGMAIMVTYASHAGRDIDLSSVAIASMIADTAISLLAGIAIFPIVFAHGLSPEAGPGLLFVTLPLAFASMPLGALMAGAFFLSLFVAALASALSMLEMPVSLLCRRFDLARPLATLLAALAAWALGLLTVFSFSLWAGWKPIGGVSVYELIDQLTSNLLLPLGGLGLAVLGGWIVPASLIETELRLGARRTALLRFALRYPVPLGILAATLAPLVL
ncbi:MAG: sodium-dependent transporter [Alphaproteobacteria bacterium]|nr:sodium-dependent transporter [Alphaproteobacteria bacterium]MCW5740376.1 sodium-dependent transporter [Alphaproteobacteria bacterium]